MPFFTQLTDCQAKMPQLLARYLPLPGHNELAKAMHYACLNGGKRLRPLLALMTAELFETDVAVLEPVIVAIEFIHCYSLLHDDLPAMDNDDMRRGKPTCHKVFGEATAILAGDALLTLAFEILSHPEHFPTLDKSTILKIIQVIAYAAGCQGMVKGQSIDLSAEGKTLSLENLIEMHRAKTGALIAASVQCGALAGQKATQDDLYELHNFAEALGLCFQIQDDILDAEGNKEILGKQTGQDVKNQKCTFVTLLGNLEAKKHAKTWHDKAQTCLDRFGDKAASLRALTTYIFERAT
ncbi:MAG: polyprenyl synthetase family protein [Proteobacteria bacterium]|nr:polyprenyl synthetase family protein [Pseudomonadota bacterium]